MQNNFEWKKQKANALNADEFLNKIVDKELLAELMLKDMPHVIVFTAKGCGSSYIMVSIVKKLIPQFCDALKCFQVDIEEKRIDLAKLGFLTTPLIIFFKGGRIFDLLHGVHSKEIISEKMVDLLVYAK